MDSLNLSNSFEPLNEVLTTTGKQNEAKSERTSMSTKRKSKPTERKSIKCLLINCQSIKNKTADIEAVINDYKPDIILGNESWLSPDILNSEIFPANYMALRKDRDYHGGGVFQAIRNDLIVSRRTDFDSDCEIIWSQCQLAGHSNKSIYLASFYRPRATDMESLDALQSSLLKMGNILQKNHVILAGDFNAPDINWPSLDSSSNSPSTSSQKLLEIVDEHDLHQLVKSPTRQQGNARNILDLVFTNNTNLVSNIDVVPGISDHDMVLFNIKSSCRKKKNVKRKVYIRKKADSVRIKDMINNLGETHSSNKSSSVDELWNSFEQSIHNIMDTCIPHKMTSSRYNLPWFNRSLRRQTRAKQRLYNKAKRSRNPKHWDDFRASRKRLHKNLQERSMFPTI